MSQRDDTTDRRVAKTVELLDESEELATEYGNSALAKLIATIRRTLTEDDET